MWNSVAASFNLEGLLCFIAWKQKVCTNPADVQVLSVTASSASSLGVFISVVSLAHSMNPRESWHLHYI